jgi:S1 RNA binding domain protein
MNTGDIVSGKVTHVTSFGAFIILDNGKTGLVHISEIVDEYIKDINDFISIGDEVKAKGVGINKQGKYELSVKQASGAKKETYVEPDQKKTSKDKFESIISDFLKKSEDRQIDIRRNLKKKQGVSKKKK